MKFLKIFFIVAFISVIAIACKTEAKKEESPKTEEVATNVQEASFAISGMTCEIGCAKKIASDLSKKEGVIDAKVIFADSVATVKFDANKTNKAELMAFVDGIAENMYKTSEISKEACKADCKMACCASKSEAKKMCEMECCTNKTDEEKAACTMECCASKTEHKKACASDCKKECCAETKKA